MKTSTIIQDDAIRARIFHIEWLEKRLEYANTIKECIDVYWDAFSVFLLETAIKAFEKAYKLVDSNEKAFYFVEIGPEEENEIDFAIMGMDFNIKNRIEALLFSFQD